MAALPDNKHCKRPPQLFTLLPALRFRNGIDAHRKVADCVPASPETFASTATFQKRTSRRAQGRRARKRPRANLPGNVSPHNARHTQKRSTRHPRRAPGEPTASGGSPAAQLFALLPALRFRNGIDAPRKVAGRVSLKRTRSPLNVGEVRFAFGRSCRVNMGGIARQYRRKSKRKPSGATGQAVARGATRGRAPQKSAPRWRRARENQPKNHRQRYQPIAEALEPCLAMSMVFWKTVRR